MIANALIITPFLTIILNLHEAIMHSCISLWSEQGVCFDERATKGRGTSL